MDTEGEDDERDMSPNTLLLKVERCERWLSREMSGGVGELWMADGGIGS